MVPASRAPDVLKLPCKLFVGLGIRRELGGETTDGQTAFDRPFADSRMLRDMDRRNWVMVGGLHMGK